MRSALPLLLLLCAGCADGFSLAGVRRTADGGATVHFIRYTPRSLDETGGQATYRTFTVEADGRPGSEKPDVLTCAEVPAALGPCSDEDHSVRSWLLADGDRLLLAAGEGRLWREDADGRVRWSLSQPISLVPDVVIGDTFYVASPAEAGRAGQVSRIDVASGAVRWSADVVTPDGAPMEGAFEVRHTPGGVAISSIFGPRLFFDGEGRVAAPSRSLVVCDMAPAELGPCALGWPRSAWPLPAGDQVILYWDRPQLLRVDAAGARRWSNDLSPIAEEATASQQPLFGGALFVAGRAGPRALLSRIDIEDGATTWTEDYTDQLR